MPETDRKPTTIMQYLVVEDSIPDLVAETGITEINWRNIIQSDAQFGLRSKAYIVPSEVRWRALLHKYINHVADCEGTDFIDDHSFDTPDLTPEERTMLQEVKDKG